MTNEIKRSNSARADTAVVSFSCSKRLRETLGELSESDDRSLSSWIRKALEAAVRRSRAKGGRK